MWVLLGVGVGVHLSVRVGLLVGVGGLLLVLAVREVEGGRVGSGLMVLEVEGAGVRSGVRGLVRLGVRGLWVLEGSAVLAIGSLGLVRLVGLMGLSVGGLMVQLMRLVRLSIGSLMLTVSVLANLLGNITKDIIESLLSSKSILIKALDSIMIESLVLMRLSMLVSLLSVVLRLNVKGVVLRLSVVLGMDSSGKKCSAQCEFHPF